MLLQTKRFLFICFTFICTTSVLAQENEGIQKNLPKEIQLNNGKTVKLTDLKEKVVLLDFWYRGCYPCLKAIPELIELQEEFKDDLVIIGINDSDNREDVTDYFAYKKVNYFSTYKSEANISKKLKINAFPTTIIINQNGEVVSVESGYQKGTFKKVLRKTIKKIIKDKSHS